MRLGPEQIRELFRQHGLRSTRQREMLYAILHETTEHPTAEELFQKVRDDDPGLGLATVYNALDVFMDCGLCRRIHRSDGGPARFDGNTGDHAHVATADGKVVDVPDDLSRQVLSRVGPELIAQIEQRMGVKVAAVSLQFLAEPNNPSA